ncbi:MAG: transcriptional activator NhaR [Acidobacteria bacterium]|nr:transcriptional activator NhaR [Acidobacteriota bacterium]
MEWLNYHHLLYFWTVAKEGSIARACEKLRLAQPTISGQLRMLEETLGEKLFTRAGRGLTLTDVGQVVFRYADEIFGLGRELQDVLKGRPHGRGLRLLVGISDLVPKLIAHRILQPALTMSEPVQIVCDEDSPERLLVELAEHRLDVVLSDTPVTSQVRAKAFNHLLGASGVMLYGASALVAKYRRGFPQSLNEAPLLLPLEGSSLRRALDEWFEARGVRPRIVGEFKDSALMGTFAQAGAGLFPASAAIAREVREQYKASPVGALDGMTEQFYAISVERKLKHPAVVAISEAARERLFTGG